MLKVMKKANHTGIHTCINFAHLKSILKVSAKITLTPDDEESRLSGSSFLS